MTRGNSRELGGNFRSEFPARQVEPLFDGFHQEFITWGLIPREARLCPSTWRGNFLMVFSAAVEGIGSIAEPVVQGVPEIGQFRFRSPCGFRAKWGTDSD